MLYLERFDTKYWMQMLIPVVVVFISLHEASGVTNFDNYMVTTRKYVLIVAYFGSEVNLGKLLLWLFPFNAKTTIVVTNTLKVFSYKPITCTEFKMVFLESCSCIDKIVLPTYNLNISSCAFRAIGVEQQPYVSGEAFWENKGYEVAILRELALTLGLHVEFTSFEIDVALDKFVEKEVDAFFGAQRLTDSISQVTHFCQDETALFVLAATPREPWKNTMQIFDVATWICIFASLICVSCIFSLFYPKETLQESFLRSIGVLLAAAEVPRQTWLHLLSWSIPSLIFSSCYSGLLASILLKPILNPETTFSRLILEGWEVGIATSSSQFYTLDTAIWDNKKSYCTNKIECFDQIFCEKFAFFGQTRFVNYLKRMERLQKLEPSKIFHAIQLQKHSIYLQPFQQQLLRMKDAGILEHLDQYGEKVEKYVDVAKFKAITLHHLVFIIILYVVLISVSVLVFILEFLYRGY